MSKDKRRRPFRLFFVFQLLLLISGVAAALAAASVLRVTIPAIVELSDEAFALSEVAELDGERGAVRTTGALLLSVKNGSITRQQVIDALKTSGLEGVKIELKMPATVMVNISSNSNSNSDSNSNSNSNSNSDSDSDLKSNASARSNSNSAPEKSLGGATITRRGDNANNKQDLSALVKELAAWSGEVEVQVKNDIPKGRLVAPASIVPGSPSVTLTFRDETGRERSVSARMIWTEPALVMTRSVKRGETLRASDVTVRYLRVNKAGAYVSRPEDIVGRALRKNLSQGEAIQKDLLITTAAVTKGRGVTIVARDGKSFPLSNNKSVNFFSFVLCGYLRAYCFGLNFLACLSRLKPCPYQARRIPSGSPPLYS